MLKKNETEKKVVATSLVLTDGTLAETVITGKGSQFAIYQNGIVTYQSTISVDGQTLAPLPKTNRLVKHGVMHFPEQATAYESKEQLVEEITQYIHRYVDITPQFERVAAYYVLLTWVYDAFNECPYVRFQGDFGSGKSRALLVIGALAYKAVFASGASTVSPIFHILDSYRGTLIFDETDFRFSDAKTDIIKILNNGNSKGFPVLRTMVSVTKEFEPQAFNVYGPKLVAMRANFEDEALESRFITEYMSNRVIRADISINLGNQYLTEASAIRNKLLMFRFQNRNKVKIDSSLQSESLSLRANQIVLPLLSLIDDEEHKQQVLAIVARGMETIIERRRESVEARVVGVLHQLMSDVPERPVALGLLTYRLVSKFGHDITRPLTSRYVGSILKKLGISTYKTSGVYVVPYGEKDTVLQTVKMFGLTVGDERER